MLVIAKDKIGIETINGKKQLDIGDIAEVSKSVYNSLKSCYKQYFDFLAFQVFIKKSFSYNGKDYKKGEILILEEYSYRTLMTASKLNKEIGEQLVFIETEKDFNKYCKGTNIIENNYTDKVIEEKSEELETITEIETEKVEEMTVIEEKSEEKVENTEKSKKSRKKAN